MGVDAQMILEKVQSKAGPTVIISDDYAVRDRAEAERIMAEQNSIAHMMMHRRFARTAQAREDLEYGDSNDMV